MGFKKTYYVVYVLLTIILSMTTVLYPYITGKFIDSLIDGLNNSEFLFLALLIVIVSVGEIILIYLKNRLNFYIKISYHKEYQKRILRSYLASCDAINFDSTVDRITKQMLTDIENVVNFNIDTIIALITRIIRFLIIMAIIIKISVVFFWICVLICPIFSFIYLINKTKIRMLTDKSYEVNNSYFVKLDNLIGNSFDVNVHSLVVESISKTILHYESVFKAGLKLINRLFLQILNERFVSSFIVILIFVIGGISIQKGELTIGEFTMLNTYAFSIISILRQFLNDSSKYIEYQGSVARLIEVEHAKKIRRSNNILDNIDTIELIKFSYNVQEKNIINIPSYVFRKGNIYCVRGSNGCGKSTFLNIMAGLNDGFEGNIKYSGINATDINFYELRKEKLKYSTQDINLSFLDEMIDANKLEGKIWSSKVVLNESKFLSGGEKRKIMIDYCVHKNSCVLLFDEPLTGLDMESVDDFVKHIKKIKKNKIIIIVSHNDELIKISDYTLHLDNNEAVSQLC